MFAPAPTRTASRTSPLAVAAAYTEVAFGLEHALGLTAPFTPAGNFTARANTKADTARAQPAAALHIPSPEGKRRRVRARGLC